MVEICRAIYESAQKLGYIVMKVRLFPGFEVCELQLLVNEHPHMCYTNFCLEMHSRGYNNTNWISITDTHFIVKFKKA